MADTISYGPRRVRGVSPILFVDAPDYMRADCYRSRDLRRQDLLEETRTQTPQGDDSAGNRIGTPVACVRAAGVLMVRLTLRQRTALGETVRELANYGAAALIFGQLVGQSRISWLLILAGVALWLAFVTFALVLEGE
jgi:hypothetical protein